MHVRRLPPSFDADRYQFPSLDEFPDALLARSHADAEVVAEIFFSTHAKRAGGDSHQRALRVFDRGSRHGEDSRRDNSLRQIVHALEAATSRRRELARGEQRFNRALAVAPSPPSAPARAGAGDFASRERAALANLVERRLHEARTAPIELPNPRIVVLVIFSRRRHSPAQQWMHLEWHQRRHVSPILEQLARGRRSDPRRVENFRRVTTETRKQRQVMRSHQHVDRIDLQQPDLRDDAAQMPPVETRTWPRRREPLRRQRNPPRLVRR